MQQETGDHQADRVSADRVARDVRSMVRRIARLDRPVRDDTVLLGSVLDSVGVLQLISDLEEDFDLAFDEEEMTPRHFRTIADVTRLVTTKLGLGQGVPGTSSG